MASAKFHREYNDVYPVRITPGPFEVSPSVLAAAERAIVGHRTDEFRAIMRANAQMLIRAFEIEHVDEYAAVVLDGTGSAAMEAMVASTAPSWCPLVLVNGRFGRRLADMATLHNASAVVLDFGVGEVIDLARVEETLQAQPHVRALLFCAQDTRDCILNPLHDLCVMARRHGLRMFIDAISAGIGEELFPDRRDIDLFTESSGKGIRGLPGLGIVCGKLDLLRELAHRRRNSYYLDLYEHFRIQSDLSEPRFGAAVSLHFAMHQALTELMEEGVTHRRDEVRRRTRRVRELLLGAGLLPLRPPQNMPNSVTSFLLPPKFSFVRFQRTLKARGFLTYSGSSVVEDCFQVGTGGYLTDEVLDEGLGIIASIVGRA